MADPERVRENGFGRGTPTLENSKICEGAHYLYMSTFGKFAKSSRKWFRTPISAKSSRKFPIDASEIGENIQVSMKESKSKYAMMSHTNDRTATERQRRQDNGITDQDRDRTAAEEPTGYEKLLSKINWNPGEFPQLFGWELKELRKELGYTAQEIANGFHEKGIPLTTARSIYRTEEDVRVKPRYVAAFRKLVGPDVFDSTLNRLRNEPGHYRERYVFDMLRTEKQRRSSAERIQQQIKKWCDHYGLDG